MHSVYTSVIKERTYSRNFGKWNVKSETSVVNVSVLSWLLPKAAFCALRAALAVLTPMWETQQGTDPEIEAQFWVGGSVSTEVWGVACAAFIISCIFPFFSFDFFFVF